MIRNTSPGISNRDWRCDVREEAMKSALRLAKSAFHKLLGVMGVYGSYEELLSFYAEYKELRTNLPRLVLDVDAAAPVDSMPTPFRVPTPQRDYTIGYSANLLNNHYNFCKIARGMGRDALLFIDSGFQDLLVTSEPFWEERDMSVPGGDLRREAVSIPEGWNDPEWVRRVEWRMENWSTYRAFDKASARSCLEKAGFSFQGFTVYDYFSFDNVSTHLDLLKEMNSVDVMQVSGTHVGVASYSQTPYVIYYYGSDAYEVPFRRNQIAKLQVRGIKRAKLHIARRHNREYLMALGIPPKKIIPLPFIIDTDAYAPGKGEMPRGANSMGRKVLFLAARQNWVQKGNDKLFKALSLLAKRRDDFICPSVWYGPDVSRSQALIGELGISHLVTPLEVMSKCRLRNLIKASHLVVDQFTIGLFGTLALEAMSCGRPVVSYLDRSLFSDENGLLGGAYNACPIVSAFSPEEIAEVLHQLLDSDQELARVGEASRKWIVDFHGHEALWPLYDETYRKALSMS